MFTDVSLDHQFSNYGLSKVASRKVIERKKIFICVWNSCYNIVYKIITSIYI